MIDVLKSKWVIFVSAAMLIMAVALSVQFAVPASAQIQDCLQSGAELSVGTDCAASAPTEGGADLQGIVTDVINIFSVIVGIVAVIMIIYGGFRYITSGGDSGNIGTAKNTILYAVVGLIIVALAQVIVRFVLGTATGA